ncbi:unnamed protein product [Schistocephalus solidus]|uniref:C-type lectin domain-containing protein n=1 Tax=Schistocephalus solidus TaxID=70667 RepID=A0A183TCF6_SCHSO|nr:unnamed protein product [Schistocephalus solidus]
MISENMIILEEEKKITGRGVAADRIYAYGFTRPEYAGIFGGVKYAIFASVEATHAQASTLCTIYFHRGRLAWLGDLEVPEMRAIANQASMYNYLNINHFFWIDGYLLNNSCNPSQERCTWGPDSRDFCILSHIAPGVSKTFETAHMACEKMASVDETNRRDGRSQLRPVLAPNLLQEFPDEDKDYVLAVAWNFEKTGFICSAPSDNDIECPFGFTEIETADVPKHLIPKPYAICK